MLRAMIEAVPMPGRYIHAIDGNDSYQPYRSRSLLPFRTPFLSELSGWFSDKPEDFLHSVNRRDLNNDLWAIAEKRSCPFALYTSSLSLRLPFDRGCKMIYNHPIERIDFERKLAYFRNTMTDTLHEVRFSLAALDFRSSTRFRKVLTLICILRCRIKRYGARMVRILVWGKSWRESQAPRQRQSNSVVATKSLRSYLTKMVLSHISMIVDFILCIIWTKKKVANWQCLLGNQQLKVQQAFHVWPRQNPTFLIALPNADNTYTLTLFNPAEGMFTVFCIYSFRWINRFWQFSFYKILRQPHSPWYLK